MSAESMLNCMLEGIAIGLFAWILLRLVGRRNSSTRFAVWFSALLAIAALPLLGASASVHAEKSSSAIIVPSAWASDIFILWAVIAGVSLLRVAIGLLQLRKLRAQCTAVAPENLDPIFRATLQKFQAARPVAFCQSTDLQVPTAIGFFNPAVVIPSWAMQELSAEELNSILIHELTHLRRRDDWTNLAQQILKALLFFHPAVWWIQSQLALEREMACDDAVLAQTANPRAYAQCLISMAEKTFLRRGLALTQAAVNRMRHTSLRVTQILDANRPNATRVWRPALYSLAAFFALCVGSLSHAPELIAFQDQTPGPMVASIAPSAKPYFDAEATATPVIDREQSRPTSLNVPTHNGNTLTGRNQIRHSVNSPAPQRAEYRTRSTTSQVAQRTAYRPYGEYELVPHTIVVVMQTAQPQEEGAMLWTVSVWRMTVLDASRIPVESRIPAKKI